VIAVERAERLHTLYQLVQLAQVENEARERGEHGLARQTAKRMREVVRVLGFDPLDYEPGRDNAAALIRSRTLRMIAAMPAFTADVARAGGIASKDVRQYMLAHILAGDVACERRDGGMWWEVVAK